MTHYRRPKPQRIVLDLPDRGRSEVVWVPGPLSTTPQVLLHGWTASKKMGWRQELVDELSMRTPLLLLDMPGHAGGPKPVDKFSFDDSAEYVIEACNALKIKRAILTGHSMGSGVALRVAAKKPSLVTGVMTIGGAARFVNARDLTTAVRLVPGLFFTGAMTLSYLPLMRNIGALSALVDAATDLVRHDWKTVADAGVAIKNFDGRGDASHLHCPAVVIVPLGDTVVPAWSQCELADLIPNAQIIAIPGHHLCVWSDPKLVANAMITGLQQIRQMQHKQRIASNQIEEIA